MVWVSFITAVAALLVGLVLGRILFSRTQVPTFTAVEQVHRDKADQIETSPPDLVENNISLEQVLDVLPVGLIVVDASGHELSRNALATSITGLRHLDLLVEDAAEPMLAAARQGSFRRETLNLFGPPQRVIELSAFPLENGAVIAIEDVSERAHLDQVRTDFVANVSHELKTPVGAISVLAETLEGEVVEELPLKLAGRIVAEAQRMSKTIDNLMDLSRIEKGAGRVVGPIDLIEVVRDAVQRVHALAERDGISVDVETSDNQVIVDGDFRQLVSAVGNVVDNAVKYSDRGSIVRVRVVADDETAYVQVEDSGIGISAEHLDRIFERFYRADKARSRDTGGTGLGLSIVRNIVTQHGGQVNVESLEGKGSTFRLSFPLKSRVASGTMTVHDHVVNQ
ncbi:MAG: GHKL domain-containing protein [Actinobacteria bacterium]|nr:GHKL domain-containing protein [Actinomycetota bacterium]